MSNPIEYLHVVDAYDSEWVPVSADVGVGAVICTFRPTSDNEPVVVAVVSRGRYLAFRRACEVAGRYLLGQEITRGWDLHPEDCLVAAVRVLA